MSYLYRYETKGIQKWILDAGRLRELAGGSALIDGLVAEARRRIVELAGDDAIVQAAAGGVTALFDSQQHVRRFASEWPFLVAHWAPGLQVVQHWMEGSDHPHSHGALRSALSSGRNHALPALPEVGPWVFRAGRSGRPAVVVHREADEKRPHLTKMDAATSQRERVRAELNKRGQLGVLEHNGERVEFDVESDRWGEGPVAVLHIDGNKIGAAIASLKGPIKAFSEGLEAATRKATVEASNVLPSGKGGRQGRIVVLGGDDLTAVVPAGSARLFVETWIRTFEAEAIALLPDGPGLTASGGIVFVNAQFPFAQAYELAEECCKRAKKAGREHSRFALLRVTTALSDLPATLHAWDAKDGKLSTLLKASAKLPRGALRGWLALHDDEADSRAARAGGNAGTGSASAGSAASRDTANLAWRRMREVLQRRSRHDWEAFAQALGAVEADPETGLFVSKKDPLELQETQRSETTRGTPIHDVLTLRQVERGLSPDAPAEENPT